MCVEQEQYLLSTHEFSWTCQASTIVGMPINRWLSGKRVPPLLHKLLGQLKIKDEELNNLKGEWAKKEQDMKQKLEVLNYEKQRSLQKQEALQREHNVLLLKLEVMEDEQENLQNNQIALLEEIEEKRKTHEERRRMLLQNLNNSFNILTNFVMSEERVMF